MFKKFVLLSLCLCLSLGLLAPAQAALTTAGDPPTNNKAVYQAGTTGTDTPYVEATNSFNDGNPAYHLITQDPNLTDGESVTKTMTVNGVTGSYTMTVHRLPAYDSTQNNAANKGLGSLESQMAANTTWFVDAGTYRDDLSYYPYDSRANVSLVGQDGQKPVLVRAPMKDGYTGYPTANLITAGYGDSLLRHGFQGPKTYIQNLIFDGNGKDMLPVNISSVSGSKNRGEYMISVHGGASDLVLRDLEFQNLGVSDYTAKTANKNLAINFFASNDTNNPKAIQKNIERITIRDSV